MAAISICILSGTRYKHLQRSSVVGAPPRFALHRFVRRCGLELDFRDQNGDLSGGDTHFPFGIFFECHRCCFRAFFSLSLLDLYSGGGGCFWFAVAWYSETRYIHLPSLVRVPRMCWGSHTAMYHITITRRCNTLRNTCECTTPSSDIWPRGRVLDLGGAAHACARALQAFRVKAASLNCFRQGCRGAFFETVRGRGFTHCDVRNPSLVGGWVPPPGNRVCDLLCLHFDAVPPI